MKTIGYMYEDIVRVNCSCCLDSHFVQFNLYKDYKDDIDKFLFYVYIKDTSQFSFRRRITNTLHFIRNWKSNKNCGEDIANHGVLIHKSQLAELYKTLKDALLQYEVFTDDDFHDIENSIQEFTDMKFPILWKGKSNKFYENYTWVPFIGDDFVISTTVDDKMEPIDSDINFGFKYPDSINRKDVWRYALHHLFYKDHNMSCGETEGFITVDNTIKLLKVIYYFSLHLKD